MIRAADLLISTLEFLTHIVAFGRNFTRIRSYTHKQTAEKQRCKRNIKKTAEMKSFQLLE